MNHMEMEMEMELELEEVKLLVSSIIQNVIQNVIESNKEPKPKKKSTKKQNPFKKNNQTFILDSRYEYFNYLQNFVPMYVTMLQDLLIKLCSDQSRFMADINNRKVIPNIEKMIKHKQTILSHSFEKACGDLIRIALHQLNLSYYSKPLPFQSDICLECEGHDIPPFILQIDAKACKYHDGDFEQDHDQLKIHIGESQTMNCGIQKGNVIQGLQSETIDGKPVITLAMFMKWDWIQDTNSYKIYSCGIVNTSPVLYKTAAGKSKNEMRMIIPDQSYVIHHL